MRRGISPLISVILLTLISVSAVYIVMYVAKPTIDRAYESAAMNEAEQNIQLLDNLIREVAYEGTGSHRSVFLKVSDGDYRVVNTSGNFTGAVQYKIDLKYSPFTAPMLKKIGNLKYTAGMNSLGLVGYWNLDERNGTVANDSSGYDNDGIVYNGSVSCANPSTSGAGCPEWVDGKFGKALSFDGVDDYISILDSNSLDVGNALTLSAWIKTGNIGQRQTIIGHNNEANTFQLEIGNSPGTVAVIVNGIWIAYTSSSVLTNNDTWYHVVYTRNGTGAGTHAIYVNGASKSLQTDASNNFTNPTVPIEIGRRASNSQQFNGTIDELQIYNRALTADEIKESYSTQSSNYQIALEYSKIILTGNLKLSKGDNKVCIEKTGELSSKPLVRIALC